MVDITERILSGKDVIYHTDGSYYLSSESDIEGSSQNHVQSVVDFINVVHPFIEQFFTGIRLPNYEDLYFAISQLRDNVYREYENPAVQCFSDQVRSGVGDILTRERGLSGDAWSFEGLLDETCNYIKDIVAALLAGGPVSTDYLGFITDAIDGLSQLSICTLNHDLLLEDYFESEGIKFTDGFSAPINDVRYWSASEFGSEDTKVELLKLHGSINWYRLRSDQGTWYDERYGIPLTRDPWHTKDAEGNLQMPVGGRPEFLAGTFNKILQYTDEIYVDLLCQFVNALRASSRVFVCGYGFSDKAINSHLIRWLYEDPERKFVVVDPNADAIETYARGAISRPWEEWVRTGKVKVISKSIAETSWAEVSEMLS